MWYEVGAGQRKATVRPNPTAAAAQELCRAGLREKADDGIAAHLRPTFQTPNPTAGSIGKSNPL